MRLVVIIITYNFTCCYFHWTLTALVHFFLRLVICQHTVVKNKPSCLPSCKKQLHKINVMSPFCFFTCTEKLKNGAYRSSNLSISTKPLPLRQIDNTHPSHSHTALSNKIHRVRTKDYSLQPTSYSTTYFRYKHLWVIKPTNITIMSCNFDFLLL